MAKREVATRATQNLPATTGDDVFEQYAGVGFENVTARDLLVPRLTILQALSPQLLRSNPKHIDGAKAGDICDVGTEELFDPPLHVLPVAFVKQYLQWAPRSSGRGLVGIHDDPIVLDQTERDERNRLVLPNGDYIAETMQFYVLNLTAGGRRSFIPMTSTQLKHGRRWLTKAQGEKVRRENGSEFTPPLFYRTWNLGVSTESNNDGEWFSWKPEAGVKLTEVDGWENLLNEARAFREAIGRGETRGDVASLGDDERAQTSNEEVPF